MINLNTSFSNLNLDKISSEDNQEKDQPMNFEKADRYFVHIDLRSMKERSNGLEYKSKTPMDTVITKFIANKINGFMIKRGFYDPRRGGGFLETLLDETQTLEDAPLTALRYIARLKSQYYELWCVRKAFHVALFVHLEKALESKLAQLKKTPNDTTYKKFENANFAVHLCIIIDNSRILRTHEFLILDGTLQNIKSKGYNKGSK